MPRVMRTIALWSMRAVCLAPLALSTALLVLMLAADAACERLTGEGLL